MKNNIKKITKLGMALLVILMGVSSISAATAPARWAGSVNAGPHNNSNVYPWNQARSDALIKHSITNSSIIGFQQMNYTRLNSICDTIRQVGAEGKIKFIYERVGNGNANDASYKAFLASSTKCKSSQFIQTISPDGHEKSTKDRYFHNMIMYDSTKYKVLNKGSYIYKDQVKIASDGKANKFIYGYNWGQFEVIGSPGKKMLFMNTYKTNHDNGANKRVLQMNQMIGKIGTYRTTYGNKNIVIAGDFNSNYNTTSGKKNMDNLRSKGFSCGTSSASSVVNGPARLDFVCVDTHMKMSLSNQKILNPPKIDSKYTSDHKTVHRKIDYTKLK